MNDPKPGAAGSPLLAVRNLAKTYISAKSAVVAIDDVSLDVDRGEFVCIVGPSGCGKTTLLKMLSGLLTPTRGEVELNGRRVEGPPQEMALVFQDYSRSLYPWMKVASNVAFPLQGRGIPARERESRVAEALSSVGLAGFEESYPWQLSGGMQQRVAIARGLAYRPDVLLMDEPFASVDAQTRSDLEDLVLQLRRELGMTILFVTHDIDESVYLADRVVILSNRPTVVSETLTVDLPSPRDQVTTKELPEFAHLRAHVYTAIKSTQRATSAVTSAS